MSDTPDSSQPTDASVDLSTLSRAQLIERIRSSSKDAVILADMQRLGFWPDSEQMPTVAADLIQRETELSQALGALTTQLLQRQDPQAALRAMRKERMAKARARREETRQKLARERFERAQAWRQRRQQELLYLGEDVSQGLNHACSDEVRLQQRQLPRLHDAHDLAQAMGLSLSELRFLTFTRKVSRISHYQRFRMAKKSGGERLISAPMPRLKRAQYWVLDNILQRVSLHPAAHGFVAGRSIISNALPHVAQEVVINLDLKDFFPSIKLPRIKGIFRLLGYSEQVATCLALLCTEAPTEQVSVDGEQFFVAHGERALPQGAPSSPMLTNILCKRLDARLQACADKLGFRYTRYADDLTFSASKGAHKLTGKLLWRVKQIIGDEGLTLHPQKQHVMRSSQSQQVTGIVVNQKPTIQRDTLKRFRAVLFQVEKDGPQGKQWNGNPNVLSALEGYARYIRMVDAAKGEPLLQKVREVRAKWGDLAVPASIKTPARHHSDFRRLAAQGQAPWANWWMPQETKAPVLEKTAEQVQQEKKAQRKQDNVRPTTSAPPAVSRNPYLPSATPSAAPVAPANEPTQQSRQQLGQNSAQKSAQNSTPKISNDIAAMLKVRNVFLLLLLIFGALLWMATGRQIFVLIPSLLLGHFSLRPRPKFRLLFYVVMVLMILGSIGR